MTQKDYITKAKPKSKPKGKPTTRAANKKSPSKKGKPNNDQKQPLPFIAIGLAVITLTAFGYFLWFINGAAEQPSVAQQLPKTTETADKASEKPQPKPKAPEKQKPQTDKRFAAKPTATANEVPPPPEGEDWEYINALKEKKVKVPVEKMQSEGPYLMQCGTFRDPRRAERLKAELALLGFESRIKVTKSDKGGYHHRVQLGPFEMNRDAQAARHKLSKHNINGCKIWLWS